MFHKILFVGVIVGFILIGFILNHLSNASDTMKDYQRYGFVQSEVHYEKVEKKWGQQGLIFYQLEFPALDVPHHVEKMTLSMNDTGVNAKLTNVRLNVKQAMQKLYASQPVQALESYIPYRDFFGRILTSLSIMGVDEFIGDILVNTTYSDLKTMDFTLQVNQENKPTLKVTGIIHVPVVGVHQLTDLWHGTVNRLDVQIQDQKRLKQYVDYAKSRKIQLPEGFKKGLISLKNLPKKLPSLSDIMR